MIALQGGRDYPRSVGEFLAWFGTDEDCRDYLAWLRLAGWLPVRQLRARRWLAAAGRPVGVRRLLAPHVGDRGGRFSTRRGRR